jgi:uncharacterized protein (TIGR00369 family)
MATASDRPDPDRADGPSIEELFPEGAGGLVEHLGITFTTATPERVVATMPVTPQHHQPLGYLHGGASVALAESVASVGGHLAAADGQTVFGVEINANHVRALREGTVTATGTPLHTGRTTQVWSIELHDDRERLVCVSRCTLAVRAASNSS